MKKQTNPNIKAHLLRSAFYLLLVTICAIPFALAERNTINLGKQALRPALAQTGVDALKALLKPRIPGGCVPAWQSGPDQPPARYAFQAALGTDNMMTA